MENPFLVQTGNFDNEVDLVLCMVPFQVLSLINKIATLSSRTQNCHAIRTYVYMPLPKCNDFTCIVYRSV